MTIIIRTLDAEYTTEVLTLYGLIKANKMGDNAYIRLKKVRRMNLLLTFQYIFI